MFAVIKYTNNMKQTNYKKSFNSLKGLFLTGLILLSSSLFGQVYNIEFTTLDFSSSVQSFNNNGANTGKLLYSDILVSKPSMMSSKPVIDCIVTYLGASTGITTLHTFDDNSSNGSWFRPDISSQNNRSLFKFEFGYYDNGVFTSYILENVALNIYDIDGGGGAKEAVSIESDYSKYELFSGSNLAGTRKTADVDFASGSANNTSSITDNSNRVRLQFLSLSELVIGLGENANKSHRDIYNIEFAVGTPALNSGTTGTDNNQVVLDLNGSTSGVNNLISYNTTNSTANFTVASTTNLTASDTSILTNITVKFNSADIKGGANEVLRVGSTDIPLNATSSGSLTLSISNRNVGFNYTVTEAGGIRTIAFSRVISGVNRFRQIQGEPLLDALQYVNKSTTGNIGTRIFSINATLDLTTDITSPTVNFVVNIPTALPVNIISFTGKATANGNQLNWTVAQEENFSHYEVLSSINGSTYNKVGEVYPENKSMDMKNYAFTDLSATADLVFYKLNLINEDGSSNFSNIVAINRNSVAPVITNVYPNPATTSLLISLEGVDAEVSTITIQDLSGKIVYSTETSDVATLLNINELNKGLYLIKVSNSNGIVSVSRFAKN
jgi:hypothetical protein